MKESHREKIYTNTMEQVCKTITKQLTKLTGPYSTERITVITFNERLTLWNMPSHM